MKWQLHAAQDRLPTIIMVSRLGHCLNDLLFRYRPVPASAMFTGRH
jgi:formyltetrahydrofolate deformylase